MPLASFHLSFSEPSRGTLSTSTLLIAHSNQFFFDYILFCKLESAIFNHIIEVLGMNSKIKSLLLRTFLLSFSLLPSLLFSEDYRGTNPYFTTGPILTPSAHNIAPGDVVIQPYIFWENDLGMFDKDRKFMKAVHDLSRLRGSLVFGLGLLNWLDFSATLNGRTSYQKGQSSTDLGDTQLGLGFQLLKEKKRAPALRLTVTESFPTGKYQKLKPGKQAIESSGSGSYETSVALNIGKKINPFNLHASFKYTIPTPVNVQGFNAYFGIEGAEGKVRPGRGMEVDAAFELSLTQNLVLACDLVYTYQHGLTFSGDLLGNSDEKDVQISALSKDSLSCAPALAYNVSENLGFLLGSWFTITGRNSAMFVAGVFSVALSW